MKIPIPGGRAFRSITLAAAVIACPAISATAQSAPPQSFSRTIVNGAESVTVNFTLHPIRSANFKVLVQGADGSFTEAAAGEPRTYLGTVEGFPGAMAAGLLKEDGTLLCRVSFDTGVEWSSTGGNASTRGSTNWTPAWPTTVVSSGGAGSNVRVAEVGVDATWQEYTACGSNVTATREMIEYVVMCSNQQYLRDAAILHRVGRIVIRADQAMDPYAGDGGDTGLLLPHQRTEWNTTIASTVGSTHDLALVARPGAGGGLAYVGTIATSSRYSANGADGNGDFYVIWRHEAGHNWGSSHYEGGGKPEGPTIMSDNSLARFSSSELAKVLAHRNSKASSLDALGAYPFPLPPRANMDRAVVLAGSPQTIDVLDNDSDSNGETISLLSFDATSAAGGTLTRSVGTGPNGRDQVVYTAPAGFTSGTDHFKYRIADASGRQALGYVACSPVGQLAMLDHWKLDEASGTTAVNSIRTARNATHSGALVNQAGSAAVTGRGVFYDGSNDHTSSTTPSYGTNVITLTAWVKRSGNQGAQDGVVYSGSSSTGTGLVMGPSNDIQFRWNGTGYQSSPASPLTLPDGQWCLVAMSVSPNAVTLHARTPSGLESRTTTGSFATAAFTSTLYFGRTSDSNRYFRGTLDDVRVYPATLSAGQIESLYLQAVEPPALTITSPVPESSAPALGIQVAATVADREIETLTFLEGSQTLGTLAEAPWAVTLPYLYAGTHSVFARATYGDWGYTAVSPVVNFTVQTPPPPIVTVAAEGAPSRSGPVSGRFIITRNHPIGEVTVPFSTGGTAIPETDYTTLPGSVTLPDGTSSATVAVDPIANAVPQGNRTVVLTLPGGVDHSAGTPSSATLTIGDHVTSVANSAWNVSTTWTNETAAPTSGTQGTGLDYAVAHTVVSNDPSSNSQAFIGKSLRILNGGVLDLYRFHAATLQTVTYNLPPLTLESGSTIRFTAGTGSDLHVIPAAITTSGTATLLINAGSYDNGTRLSGPLSGSGTLNVICQSTAGAGTYVRTVNVNSANNSYSGDWSVSFTPTSSDDSTGLSANAANALGTGTVTVGNRSRLISNATSALNSLAGVVLNGTSATLTLTQPWNNPSAALTLAGGSPVVTVGGASSVIGNLSGNPGTISGTNGSSSLTVTQTTSGTFGGSLGTNLRFTKAGAADLLLTGSLDPSLALTLANGGLGFGGNAPSIASLSHAGGSLFLATGPASAARLALSGNYAVTGGKIILTAAVVPPLGMPHKLISYGGSRSGTPAFDFINLTGIPLDATVDYGATSDSAVTVTFTHPAVLTVAVTPAGAGTAGGGGTFVQGTSTAISAVAASGWKFDAWSGSGVAAATSPTTTVVMDTTKTVTANFIPLDPYPAWIAEYDLEGADTEKDADPDGDGVSNYHEMLLGFDPTDLHSRLTLSVTSMDQSTVHLVLNRVVPTGTFVVQSSDSPGGPWAESTLTVPEAAHDHPIEMPRAGTKRFYRAVFRTNP